MSSRLRTMLLLYQWLAGCCDSATGLLLVFAPALALRLMGLTIVPQPLALLSYVGVFVLAVGLSYLWIALEGPPEWANRARWRTQWQITALVRTLVAIFVLAQVASGGLELRWLSVAATDGCFAAIQWIGLGNGWLGRVD